MKAETQLMKKVCKNEDKQLSLARDSVQILSEVLKLWIDKTGLYGMRFNDIFEKIPIVVNGLFSGDELVLRKAYIKHITLSNDAEIEDMAVIDDSGSTYYMTSQEIFDDTNNIIDYNTLSKVILQKILAMC